MPGISCKKKFIVIGISVIVFLLTLGYFSFYKPIIFEAHLREWYPTESKALTEKMYDLDIQARVLFSKEMAPQSVRALIVPHAGYIYSGDIAAAGYQLVDPSGIKRVIVLVPSHHTSFTGIALPHFDQYKTAVGSVFIDQSIIKQLDQKPLFSYNEKIYQTEHSFEMQTPFIIGYFPSVSVIPCIVGTVSREQIDEVATTLAPYINEQTLVIVSPDFTHYGKKFNFTPFNDHIKQRILQLDSGALETIQNYSVNQFLSYADQLDSTICGRNPIAILLALLEKKIFGAVEPQLIGYKTSAELTNHSDESVSYVSMIFTSKPETSDTNKPSFTPYEKKALLTLSREVLQQSFKKTMPLELLYPIKTKKNTAQHGAFVSLYKKGELRGCTGRTISNEPLYKTIIDMTKAAAFQDSRFSPVTANELDDITISISILTPAKPIASYKEIALGQNGIILTKELQSAVFLPHVATEFKWDLPTTLTELSKKAGLNPNAWQEKNVTFQTFESIDFSE